MYWFYLFLVVNEEVHQVWNELKELPGTDSSYFTKEAREELAELVKDKKEEEKNALAEVIFFYLKSHFYK